MNNGNSPANSVTIKPSIGAIRQSEAIGHGTPKDTVYTGLTKREYFAGLVIQGFAASEGEINSSEICAEQAVEWADALLKALDDKQDR